MPRIRAQTIAEHKEQTRSEILHAAQELFSQWGYEEVGFSEIADAVSIGRTTLYDYFTDKNDLLACLVEETLPTTIQEMVERLPEGPPPERLSRLVVEMIQFVVLEPTLGLLLHREVPKLPASTQERVAVAHGGLAAELAGAYRQGVVMGMLKPLPYRMIGHFLHNLIMAAAQTLIDADDPQQELPAVINAVTEMLFNGVLIPTQEKTFSVDS